MKPVSFKKRAALFVLLIFTLVLSACGPAETPTPVAEFLATSVASTMQAQATQEMVDYLVALMTEQARPTNTPQPTPTPLPSPTPPMVPTATQAAAQPVAPVQPAQPVAPVQPAATATPAAVCHQATIIGSKITDGQVFSPGAAFQQQWTIKNAGTCAWNGEFDVVHVSGDKFGATAGEINQTVAPGESVVVTIDFTAPDKAGDYTGYWGLLDAANKPFGTGTGGKNNFALHIVVK